jgi:hypothetical protein
VGRGDRLKGASTARRRALNVGPPSGGRVPGVGDRAAAGAQRSRSCAGLGQRATCELEATGVPVADGSSSRARRFEAAGRVVGDLLRGGRLGAAEPEEATAAAAHVERPSQGRAAMVQPHVDESSAPANRARLLGGRYSHAVRKRVSPAEGAGRLPELYLEEAVEPAVPSEADLRGPRRPRARLR